MMDTSLTNYLAQAAIVLPAFLLAVSFHEFCHALMATLLGDDTAKRNGRLTLNPLAHVDLLGLFCLIVFRIGWANPVPMDQRNFAYPRLYAIITALAGPISNFFLAIVSFLLIKFLPGTLFSPAVTATCVQVLSATASINIMLGVFNILPIPPLDGSHILVALLVNRFPSFVDWMYRYSLLMLIILFMLPQTRELLLFLITYTEQFIKSLIF